MTLCVCLNLVSPVGIEPTTLKYRLVVYLRKALIA